MWVHIVSFHSLSLAELRARFPAGGVSNVGELNIGYTYRSRRRGEAVGVVCRDFGARKRTLR